MSRRIYKTVAMVVVVATLASGCRSKDEYQKFAVAGSKYTIAVNKLLVEASKLRIQASSEQLLEKDRRSTPVTRRDYSAVAQADEDRLSVIKTLRSHNELLQDYFKKLQELADGTQPQQAQTAIEGVAANLVKIGEQLPKKESSSSRTGLASAVVTFAVDGQIRGALRTELEKRHKTIAQELALQQEALDILRGSIESDGLIIKRSQEERKVIEPLLADTPIADHEGWIATRQEILAERPIEELKEASKALSEFRGIFNDFISGNLSISRLNALLSEVDRFLALVEKDKASANP